MEFVRYAEADLALTDALETDPDVMRELGGPITDGRVVLPAFQGAGIASSALKLLIELAPPRASVPAHPRVSASEQDAVKRSAGSSTSP